jgi:hypothetical protein
LLSVGLTLGMVGPALRATLGLPAADPTIEAAYAVIDHLAFGGDGDLSIFGAEVCTASGSWDT